MNNIKQQVEAMLSKLPDDCSIEDIQYHLYVFEKIRQGLESVEQGVKLTQEEVEGIVGKWLIE